MSKFLEEFAAFIAEKGSPVLRIAEIYHGGEAEDLTITPCNPCQDSYSVSKAFVVAALGILSDRGLLDTEEKIPDVLGDLFPADGDPLWKDCTVRNVILHSAGLPLGYLDIDCWPASEFGEDFLRTLLTFPMQYKPGEKSVYSDGAYYLLARIAELRSGMLLDDFLWKELFWPLGFREAAWSHCPMGHPMGATGLYCYTRDMVKLGGVLLGGGEYRGRRYLSEAWVARMLNEGFEMHGSVDEGYAKGGMCGQNLAIFPLQDRAVAWHGFGDVPNGELMRWISAYGDRA